jgi:hypothetical protein
MFCAKCLYLVVNMKTYKRGMRVSQGSINLSPSLIMSMDTSKSGNYCVTITNVIDLHEMKGKRK